MADSEAMRAYDLHTHSVHSDGTTTPEEIAREAATLGLAGFALTDHDTISGWPEAREAAAAHGIEFLPGMELTTQHAGYSRHLLGYGMDPAAAELFAALDHVRTARIERAREMVRRVSRDYAIRWEDVVGDGDARTVGRPHVADALVAGGYFPDRSTAFEVALHPGSPYYLGTYALDTSDTIRMVHRAGGRAVLAHPAAMRQRSAATPKDIAELAVAGLWGVELNHPENREDWLPPLVAAVAELGLETTGASDYHGAGKTNRLGERTTPGDVVDRLRADLAVSR
ncbi:PHP domain-containing protein [Leucobacter chromiireducens]|uniref:PHP domain-containing protein n=1 Tax=Leucobacter chromiireducens subsp. solipictus TaxID=398235 RepID=A0ABS1SEX6_9MICO|nr:PHP domain-containing protein [Leucobacter chromiireducens]MBL3678044.1 PHP domain-containing protein [Leucobacter chromiireducens subsp. solipictus]